MYKYLLVALLVLAPFTAVAQSNTVTSTVTGTTTVDKTPPTASAPSIVINNQDVCTSATSVAVQTQILGIATGQTITDENCERLKLARSLYGMGMKVAAVALLCQDDRVFNAMSMAGTPCPIDGEIGEKAKQLWEEQQLDEELLKDLDNDINTHTVLIPILLFMFFGFIL